MCAWDEGPGPPVRHVTEGPGMDRNISEQLNKAFEAYRNVSIEKELARKELQHKVAFVNYQFPSEVFYLNQFVCMRVGQTDTYVNPLLLQSEQYQRHTQMLERTIEEQAKTILHLKAELSSVRKHAPG